MAAVARRAESLGISAVSIAASSAAILKICADSDAGTALGKLTWAYRADGERTRRMGIFGGDKEPWLTDAMLLAAEDYRALWVHWHRLTGLPRRNPQGQQFDRAPKSIESAVDYGCKAGPAFRSCRCEVCKTDIKLKAVDAKFRQCPHPVMARRMVEMVVTEDTIPTGIDLGQRAAALCALRDGLAVLARYFGH
jgi:hypothetical protein